jgi:hypothetical protein
MDRRKVERAVASARSKAERIAFIGALLSRATGNEAVVVGGSAVEVLTSGKTSSRDIDIVTPREEAVRVVLSWGFKPSGRIFRREDWGVDIDLVGGRMTGNRRLVRRIETPYGLVRIAGPEDLIAKRLTELKHWPTSPEWRRDLIRQVRILLAEYGSQLDEEYLALVAKRDDIEDILRDFRSR